MMYFVYVLECGDGSLYTGITTDIARRLAEHREGKGAKYTRSRGALAMRYTEAFPDRSSALQREAVIKRMSRAEKLALCS